MTELLAAIAYDGGLSLTASTCKESFEEFVRLFWDSVPGTAPLKWNWHMGVLCTELQEVAERVFANLPKDHDTIVNISPGTSKSTVSSILFPAWVWTRMAHCRIMTASHTSDLVLDLASKSRHVIKSDLYRTLFPYVTIREDQDTKSYFANTAGGDRYTCTVAGRSPMGFHAHIILCFPWETQIVTDHGTLPIGKIVDEKLPVRVLAYDHETGQPCWREIIAYEKNPGKELHRATFSDGTHLEATEEHPVYVVGKGYVALVDLQAGDEVIHVDPVLGISGKAIATGTKIVSAVERTLRLPEAVYNIRVAVDHNYFAEGTLVHNCDDPLDPKKAGSEAERTAAKEFFDAVLPGRMVDKTVTVMFLIMQRLHEDDPTGHLLRKAKREGAGRIRHFCIPAELPDEKVRASVSPPELLACYGEDGLMDPVRLPRSVLKERFADGIVAYSGQYLQSPVTPGGSMFREVWFGQRVRASPYNGRRVLYIDKAFTSSDDSCNTACVVITEHEGNWYVGPCWVGKWEPSERDDVILGAAQHCRDRWGPHHEPTIVIEQEPAAGVDSYRHLAKKLAGFRVHPDPVRQNKEQRADPWSSQCAAGNVFLVEDGSGQWNVVEWIREHTHFPLGKYKDQVDASASGFAWLAKKTPKKVADGFKVITLRGSGDKTPTPRIIVCTEAELEHLVVEGRGLLVAFRDPPSGQPAGGWREGDVPPSLSDVGTYATPAVPAHGISTLLGSLVLEFADIDVADYQDYWDRPLAPYGKTPNEVAMKPEHGKRLWFLLRKPYPVPWELLVLVDRDGGRRALSVAYAVADQLRLDLAKAVYAVGNPEMVHVGVAPTNAYVFAQVKNSRGLVV